MKHFKIYNRLNFKLIYQVFGLLCIFIFPVSINAQENFPTGSRPAALGNAYVMESDIWSVNHNQAGLGDYHNFSLGFHHENKFLVKEFSLHSLALTVPVKPGTIGFNYTYFGYPRFNKSKIGVAFGKKFGEKFSAGVSLNYHFIYIADEYEDRNALTVEGGIQYKPVKSIHIGVHVFNPTRSRLSPSERDTLPTILRTGVSWMPWQKLWMAVETEANLNNQFRFKAGVEYQLLEGLFLRTGILTNPVENTFGLGFKIKKITADIAFSRVDILGIVPHFSLQIKLK